jgi:hypothetical protein
MNPVAAPTNIKPKVASINAVASNPEVMRGYLYTKAPQVKSLMLQYSIINGIIATYKPTVNSTSAVTINISADIEPEKPEICGAFEMGLTSSTVKYDRNSRCSI